MGAIPVISPFRPLSGTALSDAMPMPAERIYDIYEKVLGDCKLLSEDKSRTAVDVRPEVKFV